MFHEDLLWSSHITILTKKAQKKVYFPRKLRKAKSWSEILASFYRGAIESILISQTGMVRVQLRTQMLCSGWLRLSVAPPSTEHQWYWCSEMFVQNPKDIKRQHPAKSSGKRNKNICCPNTRLDCETQFSPHSPFYEIDGWLVVFFSRNAAQRTRLL